MMDAHNAEIIAQEHPNLSKRIEAVDFIEDPLLLEMLAVSDESYVIQKKSFARIKELAPGNKKAKKVYERFCRHKKLTLRMDNAKFIQEFMETSKAKKVYWFEFYLPEAPKNLKIYKQLRNFCETRDLKTINFSAYLTDNFRHKTVNVNRYKTIWVEEYEWILLVKSLFKRYDEKLDYKYSLIKFWKGRSDSDNQFIDWSWMVKK